MFDINIGNFLLTLPIMLYGMGGIFIVFFVIILFVLLLLKLFPVSTSDDIE